jgi:hypothetical protein
MERQHVDAARTRMAACLVWIGSGEEHYQEAQPDRFAPRRRVMRDDDGGTVQCSWLRRILTRPPKVNQIASRPIRAPACRRGAVST